MNELFFTVKAGSGVVCLFMAVFAFVIPRRTLKGVISAIPLLAGAAIMFWWAFK